MALESSFVNDIPTETYLYFLDIRIQNEKLPLERVCQMALSLGGLAQQTSSDLARRIYQ